VSSTKSRMRNPHALHRHPYNHASMRRVLLILILCLCACRREAPSPSPPKPPAPRLIFVGLDGADWQLLDRFIADGTMPNLAALVREGDRAVLRTQHPPLSPLVWTTMMTGVSPLEHRILDFTRFNPETHEREPITSDERAVPALWNMASSAGKRVAVYGLWATYPAEEVNGVLVSDRLFSFQYDAPPPRGAVFPATEQRPAMVALQEVATGIGFDALHRYVPELTPAAYARASAGANPFADPVTALRRILIETEVLHRLAAARIERERPDLAIVYIQGTDAIGHLFAPYFPPKLPSIAEADFARYQNVPRVYFQRIDAILGDYRRLAAATGAQLVIASDHGFRWMEGRSPVSSTAVATAARWHRDEGIFVHWPRSGMAAPPTVAELCPTLLQLLGMNPDVSSYRRAFRHTSARTQVVNAAANEELAKLKALGYVGSGEPALGAATSTRTAGSFNNEGLILRELHREEDAERAFTSALQTDPKSASAMWNLSELLRKKHDARADALLDQALAIDPDEPRWLLTRGRFRLERHDCRGALADFARATQLTPDDALAYAALGTAHSCLGDDAAARKAFARSLDLDSNQPQLRR
jgi:Flp pilus assembly protein TadD